jgi:2-hydroxychromene-2-carboxylate isomerase
MTTPKKVVMPALKRRRAKCAKDFQANRDLKSHLESFVNFGDDLAKYSLEHQENRRCNEVVSNIPKAIVNPNQSNLARANVPPGHLEVWFEFGSPYSYLTVMRIENMAALHGVIIDWRPVLLGPIFKNLGWQSSPFLEQKGKLVYMWRDLERESEKYGLQWKKPTVFPRVAVLPLRVALAFAGEPWVGDFCRAMMIQNFIEDRDIGMAENVERALAHLHLPVADIIAEAQTEANKNALRKQTERAEALGIFGGPTFFAGDEMFWGNDRLEDAMALAAVSRP